MLVPCKEFKLSLSALPFLSNDLIQTTFIEPILTRVAQAYQHMVLELLQTEKRLGESLMRMRRAKGGKVTEEGDSDEDKIKRQMHLDTLLLIQEVGLIVTLDSR